MKIKEKEAKEYKDIKSLAEAMETTLDEVVFTLQKSMLSVLQIEWYSNDKKYTIAGTYLKIIREINKKYDTNYAEGIDRIRKHFQEPARY